MSGPLSGLARLSSAVSRRASSWDQTGGNRDFVSIEPGGVHQMARIDEPGVVRHVWMTTASDDPAHLRSSTIQAHWAGASTVHRIPRQLTPHGARRDNHAP